MKQLQLASILYAGDNNEQFPGNNVNFNNALAGITFNGGAQAISHWVAGSFASGPGVGAGLVLRETIRPGSRESLFAGRVWR